MKTVGNKTIACTHTGLSHSGDCGTQSEWYTYVFVGSISAVTPIADDENEVHITPEEVFLGDPGPALTVLTSQALCLPKLVAGDRWLFYLRKEQGKPIVLDYYGNDSSPVDDVREDVDILRRLRNIGNSGIVRGWVMRGNPAHREPVPNSTVVARRLSDGMEFVSTADANGRYQFPALPSGKYTLTADPAESSQAGENGLDVRPGTCQDLTVSRFPPARLAGRLLHADGSPVANAEVFALSADDSSYVRAEVDEQGNFLFHSLEPGEYVLGMSPSGAKLRMESSPAGWSTHVPPDSLYYPGAGPRSAARVIKLAPQQERNDVNFIVPAK
jgi:hypothetical protein